MWIHIPNSLTQYNFGESFFIDLVLWETLKKVFSMSVTQITEITSIN